MSAICGYEVNVWQNMLCLKLEDKVTRDIAVTRA